MIRTVSGMGTAFLVAGAPRPAPCRFACGDPFVPRRSRLDIVRRRDCGCPSRARQTLPRDNRERPKTFSRCCPPNPFRRERQELNRRLEKVRLLAKKRAQQILVREL